MKNVSGFLSITKRCCSWLIPVRSGEWPRFLSMCGIFFLLTFIYDLLRPLKSALVIAEPGIGAELIPYIKVWGLLPGAFFMTALAIRLGHRFSREFIFYFFGSFYIAFFLLFLFFLYPNRDLLTSHSLIVFLQQNLPSGFHYFIKLVEKWPIVLFYTVTELWGNIFLSMLFWGFSNEINSISEARRFYPLYLLGANSAAIFAGQTGSYFSKQPFDSSFIFGSNVWEQSLFYFLISGVLGTAAILFLFYQTTSRFVASSKRKEKKGHKKHSASSSKSNEDLNEINKPSLKDCMIHVFKNRHLGFLALMVFSYNLVFNLSDVVWTSELNKIYFDDINGYTYYSSQITTLTGFVSVFLSLFVTGRALRRFGWKPVALITPIVVLIFGASFFLLLMVKELPFTLSLSAMLSFSLPQLMLILGTLQMAFSRGCKYTVFDTTKEIAFIPLSKNNQRIGKAVIDGIGSRFGKSSGSLIFQFLFLFVSTLDEMVPFVSCFIFMILGLWIWSVLKLSKEINCQHESRTL